ncbi:conserved membrane hypothetical protein [Candidatus Desulfarcum epimagneticum]|uniref:Mechanosensitive ion channel protein MscS n=1 Tax=uncultured Desulfobacteraceae bacterium TaxID=218296 RepID=A0A484HJ79_9BACT|nr:conserved membrane hypothetical protein [uncultured Desulfobacteraceae bacterium]
MPFDAFFKTPVFGAAPAEAAAALVAGAAVFLILKKTFALAERRMENRETSRLKKRVFKAVRALLLVAAVFLPLIHTARLFSWAFFEKALLALFILSATHPAYRLLDAILDRVEKRIIRRTETHIDDAVFAVLNKLLGAFFFSMAVIASLDILGVNVMPFIAGAGIVGIAIGFAAKDTLSNLIAGILLIIDRPFEVGDRIEVWASPPGSSSWGDVVHIGLRATRIKTTDNIVIIIPNNEIMKRDIVNYTILSRLIRIRVDVGISYDSDIAMAKEIVLNAATSAEGVMADPAPRVFAKGFGDSSIDIQAIVWIDDARKKMDATSFIIENIKKEFDKQGIEIPYPKRDVTLIRPPGSSPVE